ncbi:hypothetical protein SAMN05216464_109177 [Mucilaginibacter pineti]|uniref:Outer membrane protein beta-barrel domain-containing protein n=1 Tax=Mucilaginibacter pineti TaxID=1391627 RepID=A0A1G7FRP8_9SPHI|nr:hypothetical protein [Mucilaginibacter pineti]SDE78395.1 hypothetical protein SAMN05216464_109177 [Mucilaginibacter pineti]
MKFLYLTLLLSLSISLLHAQSNYKPGYIINNNKDTLKGFINYREWSKNPQSIKFKPGTDAQPVNYTVNNINEFAVSNLEYYKKFIVRVSRNNVDVSSLPSRPDTSYSIDTVFLKNIVNGKHISLFSFSDDLKVRYYVFNNNSKRIDELKYNLYMDDQTNTVVTGVGYKAQLSQYASAYQPENSKLGSKILARQYREIDLVQIFRAINGGTDQQITHSTSGVRYYAGAGAKSTKLVFSGDNGPFADNVGQTKTSPTLSAGIDIFDNISTKRFFLRINVDAGVNHFNISNTKVTEPTGIHKKSDLYFKQYSLSVSPQVMYNIYSANNFQAFIGAGVSFNTAAYNNYNYISSINGGTEEIINKYPEFQKFYISFPFKAGMLINKHMELYGAYSLPTSITQYTMFSASVSAYQVGINYVFGNK